MIKEVAWRGKGSVGGVQGLRFRGLTRTKRRKMAFFEGCPVGWGGYPPELVDGEVDQDLIPDEGVREGLAWEKGWVISGRRGKGSGGGARASVPGG